MYDTDPRNVSIQHSATIRTGWQMTLGDIRTLAATQGVPDSAVVTIRYESGDQREGTSESNLITLSWSS